MRIGRTHDVVTAEPLVSPVPAASSPPAATLPEPAARRAVLDEPRHPAAAAASYR